MKVGDKVFLAYTGNDTGYNGSVDAVILTKRTPASWEFKFYEGFNVTFKVFDSRANRRKLFVTEEEARAWVLKAMNRRLKSAKEVVKRREDAIRQFQESSSHRNRCIAKESARPFGARRRKEAETPR